MQFAGTLLSVPDPEGSGAAAIAGGSIRSVRED
jgi:hypothetical protein